MIRFTHEEIEALLKLINDVENEEIAGNGDPLSMVEKSAKDKLKRIYARQILAHERTRQNDGR